jgi:hypothetical protein
MIKMADDKKMQRKQKEQIYSAAVIRPRILLQMFKVNKRWKNWDDNKKIVSEFEIKFLSFIKNLNIF